MKPGILILNFNGMRWLPGLLNSLKQHAISGQLLYVVDNASTDDSLAWIEAEHPEVRIIRHSTNLGYAEAYNRAVPIAFADGCDWVCLQNTDTVVRENWLRPIVSAAADRSIGVMGPVFTEWTNDAPNYYMKARCADIIDTMFDDQQPPLDRDWVEGSSIFIRRECFQQLGGLNPLYFMYWEEAEFCRRARRNDWRVVVVPGAICRHYAGGSSTADSPGFLLLRNHFIYRLTDPFHGFTRNILSAMRLSLTYAKQSVWDHPSLARTALLARALWSTGRNVVVCRAAWRHARLTARKSRGSVLTSSSHPYALD